MNDSKNLSSDPKGRGLSNGKQVANECKQAFDYDNYIEEYKQLIDELGDKPIPFAPVANIVPAPVANIVPASPSASSPKNGMKSSSESSPIKKACLSEENAIIGFKGMRKIDGKHMCRQQEYKIGVNYVLCQEPKLCSSGFHFCRTLDQVFQFYPPTSDEISYFLVKGWGDIEETGKGDSKIASNKMQVIKEIDPEDIFIAKLAPYMRKIDLIIADNPNAVISGSLALILMKMMPYREIGDIDITLPYFGNFDKAKVVSRFGKSGEETIQMTLNGLNFDLFINPTVPYFNITFLGKSYKVADFKPIIEAKFRYLLKGKQKHASDLIHVINNINHMNPDSEIYDVEDISSEFVSAKSLTSKKKVDTLYSFNNYVYEFKTDLSVPNVNSPVPKILSENFADNNIF